MLGRLRNRYTALIHDLVVIPVAWLGAYWLRFNLSQIPDEYLSTAIRYIPVLLFVQGITFWYVGLYRGVWRFASMPDLQRILKAVTGGVLLSAMALFLLNRLDNVPRSVFILDAFLLILLLGGPRFIYRWLKDRRLYGKLAQNVLIVGAGNAGELLVRDLLRDPQHTYRPVAFVDDDAQKQGKELHGLRVAGNCELLPDLVEDLKIRLILIALPSASSQQMQRVVGICESTGIPFRALPKLHDLVSGQVSLRDLRDVRIEDLLGRESVELDWPRIIRDLENKVVLISGGGGSIGSELCRQVAKLKPSRLIVYEQSEFNLYLIETELRRTFPDLYLVSLLGDITDAVAVDRVQAEHRPQIIFHAAAYKHVPMLEHQVRAAVLNNVIGTRILADSAHRHGCATFVMISTDKAVNPANIMGMTKRVAELYCQNLNAGSKTHFITVRFGNVLGSAGSVIPLFQKQIAAGGPVTVTHPDITRYFMTIPEAAQLILQAGCMGKGGEIYVLDMGEPVKISYLAEQLIRLSGKKPNEDIQIVYTGLRPGEKLYEELFHESEQLQPTSHPMILQARSRSMEFVQLVQNFNTMEQVCGQGDDEQLFSLLGKLVPEHQAKRIEAPVAATPDHKKAGMP